jgi:PAS domain S-box-containing protein
MIAESIPHIVWTASPDGATTYFNRQGTDYTGCPRETNYEWNWVTLVHPEDAERAAQAWQHATMTGTDYSLEYRIRRFDGVFRWHAFRAIPLRDAAGEIDLWIGTATDSEDQKQLELALRRAEREATEAVNLLRSIEAATPIGIKLVDRDLRVVRINQTLADIDGLSVEECIGLTVAELVCDLWPQLENVYRRALAGETVSNVDVSKPSAADPHRMRHWLASYYPVRIDGETIGVGNVVVDTTERKEAEEFRAVVMDNMAEGLYALDADGLVTYMNPAAALMLGWTDDELRGKPMHATVHFQRADGRKFAAEECSFFRSVLKAGAFGFSTTPTPVRMVRSSPLPIPPHRCGAARLSKVSLSSSVTSPKRRRNRRPPNGSSTPSCGSDASATRSTRTGSSCTPSPSCPSPTADPARSCSCA